jgi:DNA-binding NarL/FixJ family response regulator
MEMGASQIVLLDRHPMWIDCICSVLDRMGMEVVVATTVPDEALAAVAEHRPQFFVVDAAVHDGESDWLTLIEEALAIAPGSKVVAMSACEDADVIAAAFAAGASAYVVKTAVHVATGTSVSAKPRQHADEKEALTRREFEILQFVTEGFSNAAIGRKLWVTEQTVKFHLSNLYRKIGVQNRTAAARWAEQHGVMPVESVSDDAEHLVAGSAA